MHASSTNQTRMMRSVETQTSPYIVNIIVFHGLLTIRIWFDDIVVEKFNYINIILKNVYYQGVFINLALMQQVLLS